MLKVGIPRQVWSRRLLLLFGVIFFLGVVYLDWKSDPAVSWIVFYLVPIGLVTWYFGKWIGSAAALGAALMELQFDWWQITNLPREILLWNFLVRLLTFVVMVALVEVCRALTAEVARQTAARMASLEAELAARKMAADASRQLAQEVTRAEIAERRRLAHDLHDSFGQELSALKMSLQRTSNVMVKGTSEWTLVDAACQQVSRLIEQTRQMTFELHPATLDDFGLVATLRHYAE
ncbi:MAG: histidine kinase, partial [Phycisphaerae bacterium]